VRWRTALGKGWLFVVPVGLGRRPHSPHRSLQHLMRCKCHRFAITVLPESEARRGGYPRIFGDSKSSRFGTSLERGVSSCKVLRQKHSPHSRSMTTGFWFDLACTTLLYRTEKWEYRRKCVPVRPIVGSCAFRESESRLIESEQRRRTEKPIPKTPCAGSRRVSSVGPLSRGNPHGCRIIVY